MKPEISNENPSFCYIAPTPYLHLIPESSRTHLVLAHLVDRDPTYADFYAARSKAGDFIMMDNSAYELKVPYEPNELVRLGVRCGADAIVLPDFPFQEAAKTQAAAEKFIPEFKQAGFGTFFVPQSKRGHLEDWIESYQWAATHPDIDIIGMSILGIPNALPEIEPAYARVVMTRMLIDRKIFNHTKHHHYLGLNAGPALEIPSLIKMSALTTIDSSNPIWMAILGHSYTQNSDSYLPVTKVNMPVRFDQKLTTDSATIRRIEHNIALTEQLLSNNNSNRVWYAEE